MQQIIKLMVVLASLVMGAISAYAQPTYLASFQSTYPAAATALGQCVLCHIDPAGGGPTNPFGTDYGNNGHNFQTIEPLDSDGDGFTNIVEIQALTWPGDATSYPTTTPPPATCTSFTYSAWGACQSNNTQIRTVTASSPAGCTGGTPVTSQTCTYVAPTCTSFTYSAWGACQSNNTQTRTVTASSPAGCAGGTPLTSQSCTYVQPQACTSYTYTIGACQPNGTAPVTSYTGIPAGCSGGATPATSQSCTYTAPPPATSAQIGVFRNGNWYMDVNQNMMWDPGVDAVISFGMAADIPVIGDWNGNGIKKIGVFRNGTWYLDTDGNNAWDASVDAAISFGMAGDIPVVGDWNGDGKTKIGVFRNGTWYLDYPGTGSWVGCGAPADPTKDACISYGMAGDIPVVGDWNGNGKIKIGVFRNGIWYLDANGNNAWDPGVDTVGYFGMAGDIPIVGDWNGDGKTKIGVFRNGNLYLDTNGSNAWDPGVDTVGNFGMAGDKPIVR